MTHAILIFNLMKNLAEILSIFNSIYS